MTVTDEEFYFPGGDGKWESLPLPQTLKEAQQRIIALEMALSFYSDARSYVPNSKDNECPTFTDLLEDQGLTARIGRLSHGVIEFAQWMSWTLNFPQRKF